MNNKKLTFSALLIALGTITGYLIYIPIGVAKAFPVQHLINILSAVLLGPTYAVWNAFVIPFAFSSAAGAVIAALFLKATEKAEVINFTDQLN